MTDTRNSPLNRFKERLEKTYGEFKPEINNTKLTKEKYKNTNARTHLYRAANFATNVSMISDDLLTNSGIITKHQRKLGRLSRTMTAGAAAFTAYSLLEDGPETAASNIAGFTAGSYGYRVSKELGHAGLKSIGAKSIAGVGGVMAGLGGFALAGAAAVGLVTSISSDNFIKELDGKTGKPNLVNEVKHSHGTLTQRQKMLNKLSKSGLNDRGQLLGNEAQIIRGIL